MATEEIPETRYPYFVAVGFGGDDAMALSLTNLAGQAVNSTEVPGVPRPRPIDGQAACVAALRDSAALAGLPLVVRSKADADRLLALLPEDSSQVTLIESVEEDAPSRMRTPSQRWVERWTAGEEARLLGQQDISLDEARNLSARLFYCLSGLSIDQRRSIWGPRASTGAHDRYSERSNSRSAQAGQ